MYRYCTFAGYLSGQSAGLSIGVPVLLDQVVLSTYDNVVCSTVGSSLGGTESPGTLIGVLLARGIIPGVQVGVGSSFDNFVSKDGDHAIDSNITVGRRALVFRGNATTGASSSETSKQVLEILSRDGS